MPGEFPLDFNLFPIKYKLCGAEGARLTCNVHTIQMIINTDHFIITSWSFKLNFETLYQPISRVSHTSQQSGRGPQYGRVDWQIDLHHVNCLYSLLNVSLGVVPTLVQVSRPRPVIYILYENQSDPVLVQSPGPGEIFSHKTSGNCREEICGRGVWSEETSWQDIILRTGTRTPWQTLFVFLLILKGVIAS